MLKQKTNKFKKRTAYNLEVKNGEIPVCYIGDTNFDREEYCKFASKISDKKGEGIITIIEIPETNINIENKVIKVNIQPTTSIHTTWRYENSPEDRIIYHLLNKELKIAKFPDRLF